MKAISAFLIAVLEDANSAAICLIERLSTTYFCLCKSKARKKRSLSGNLGKKLPALQSPRSTTGIVFVSKSSSALVPEGAFNGPYFISGIAYTSIWTLSADFSDNC